MKVVYSSDEKKIFAIAEFHEKFLAIHPFLDGNGRAARALASIQYRDLLGKNVEFSSMEKNNYYEALESAHNGSKQKLNNIFRALIKE